MNRKQSEQMQILHYKSLVAHLAFWVNGALPHHIPPATLSQQLLLASTMGTESSERKLGFPPELLASESAHYLFV